jgi:hypothetical protein
VNIYGVGDKMTKKGWSLNALQGPACLHICCTVAHLGHHDEFIADLKASGRWVIAVGDESRIVMMVKMVKMVMMVMMMTMMMMMMMMMMKAEL